jgi:hypothetical protein
MLDSGFSQGKRMGDQADTSSAASPSDSRQYHDLGARSASMAMAPLNHVLFHVLLSLYLHTNYIGLSQTTAAFS